MFASYRFRKVVVFISASLVLFISPPSISSETTATPNNVPQHIFNLDLCTLAYQLYHQSLCLPLDPWYDMFARVGSDRRDNICRFTHEYAASLNKAVPWMVLAGQEPESEAQKKGEGFYSGPAAARGLNDTNFKLDPILSNYKHIDTEIPTFNRDGERFLAVFKPSYALNIKVIEGVRYKNSMGWGSQHGVASPQLEPGQLPPFSALSKFHDVERYTIREYPQGEDHLIVFEGGTGNTASTEPSWSLMGFVLMKKESNGYDAHIVFRGSRSGASLSKTVWKAQDFIGDPKGNADWITDLRGSKQIEQPYISKVGKVTQGFAQALPTMLKPITRCCRELEQKYGAPKNIFVTGHSLGAGLASQYVSAVLQGGYGDDLKNEVKSWPWDKIKLIAYAQPVPGDPVFAANFDKISPAAEHYWVEGDAVVEATSNRFVSMVIDDAAHCGVQKKLNAVADCKDNPHEVFVIRDAMLRDLSLQNRPLSQQLGAENTWGYYQTFSKMLTGQAENFLFPGAAAPIIVTDANLRNILQTDNFSSEFANWLEKVYARMIADKSSYRMPSFSSTLDSRRQLVLDVAAWLRKPPTNDNAREIASLVNQFNLINGNLGLTEEEQWIFCGMILSRFQDSTLTLNELLSQPEIKACFDSRFN